MQLYAAKDGERRGVENLMYPYYQLIQHLNSSTSTKVVAQTLLEMDLQKSNFFEIQNWKFIGNPNVMLSRNKDYLLVAVSEQKN